jgi:predicted RNA binding protein YcfA (HicA-like mRNA interferase family)
MADLPQLTYKELLAMLRRFSISLRGEGSPIIVGANKKGNSFTVHHHPSQRVTPSKLAKILRYLEVSHEEFNKWYK